MPNFCKFNYQFMIYNLTCKLTTTPKIKENLYIINSLKKLVTVFARWQKYLCYKCSVTMEVSTPLNAEPGIYDSGFVWYFPLQYGHQNSILRTHASRQWHFWNIMEANFWGYRVQIHLSDCFIAHFSFLSFTCNLSFSITHTIIMQLSWRTPNLQRDKSFQITWQAH